MIIHGARNASFLMSLDNMLAASHALSICQNGCTLDLKKYPTPVRAFVTSVVETGKIDDSLKKLNRRIVHEIKAEGYSSE